MRGKNTKKGVQRLTTGEAPVPRESKRRGVHRDWGELTFDMILLLLSCPFKNPKHIIMLNRDTILKIVTLPMKMMIMMVVAMVMVIMMSMMTTMFLTMTVIM